LANALRSAWVSEAVTDSSKTGALGGGSSLSIRRYEQLAWLNIEPTTIRALRATTDILPSPTPINVNTAPPAVLAAVLGVDLGVAQRLADHRQRTPFTTVEALKPMLTQGTPVDPQRVAVSTQHFEVSGRLRLDERVLEERSLVLRRGTGNTPEVITLHRERRSLDLAPG
jgi:general secretion pathway protein K